jgi:aspartyl-tRNA(Asn)/glutamyl-tRNA(Gln) amidotransferase subunit B
MSPEALAELVQLVEEGTISSKIANDIFGELFISGEMPKEYVKAKGLAQISDTDALAATVESVLADNPDEVAAYRGGKTKLLSFFVGQVMRATRGKANPALVNKLLKNKLG